MAFSHTRLIYIYISIFIYYYYFFFIIREHLRSCCAVTIMCIIIIRNERSIFKPAAPAEDHRRELSMLHSALYNEYCIMQSVYNIV